MRFPLRRRQGRIVVARRASGLGDMLAQASQLGRLAELNDLDCYIDWRKTFYGDPNDPVNLFGTVIFHDRVKSITTLKNYRQVLAHGCYIESTDLANSLFRSNLEETCKLPLIIDCPVSVLSPSEYFPFLREFRFHGSVYEAADELLSVGESRYLVGIHYRHGNGEFSELKSGRIVEEEIASIHKLYRSLKAQNKNALALVCTDSITSSKIFEDLFYPDEILVSCKNLPDPDTGPMHYRHLVEQHCEPSNQANLFHALLDMVALSRCDILLRARFGSFADWSESVMQFNPARHDNFVIDYPYMRSQFSKYHGSHVAYLRAQDRLKTSRLPAAGAGAAGPKRLNASQRQG